MDSIISVVLLLVVISIPVYALIRMLLSFIRKTEQKGITFKVIDAFYLSGIYWLLVFGLYLNSMAEGAGVPLRIFEETGQFANGYASLASEFSFSVLVLLTFGYVSFLLILFSSDAFPPIIYVLCSSIMILNVIFATTYLIHTGFTHDGEIISIYLLQFSFLSLIFLYIARLKSSLDTFIAGNTEKQMKYDNKILQFLANVSNRYQNMAKLWAVCLFPVLVIVQLILILFGQRPDSLVRVFLETSSFNFSSVPAPKPEVVKGDGHYLCTVAAKGHPKLVKPIRMGIRRGAFIPVNRQLLIANAFENLLEQYIPNVHKTIRAFYDKYGYPISKHINTKWSADLVYILMKPLEWIFLIVLYTVDKNPENRIHLQYSGVRLIK